MEDKKTAQRKAEKAYHDRQRARGVRPLTLMVYEEDRERFKELARVARDERKGAQ